MTAIRPWSTRHWWGKLLNAIFLEDLVTPVITETNGNKEGRANV